MMECDIYDTMKMIDHYGLMLNKYGFTYVFNPMLYSSYTRFGTRPTSVFYTEDGLVPKRVYEEYNIGLKTSQDSFLDTIKPLLAEGREGELCEWMKEIGLLLGSMKCPTPTCNGLEMHWKKARIIDKFNWLCTECKKKVPIKTGSFVEEFQCSVKASVETMLAWCQNVNPEDVVIDGKTMKTSLVRKIYGQCTFITDWYMQNHPELSQLGGEGSVVLVDIFPDGSMTTAPHNNNYSKTILCVADTSHMPARVWAQVVDQDLHKDYGRVLSAVLSHVRPQSTLVVTPRLFPDLLQYAKGMSEVISVEALMSLDPDDYQRSLKNLETIWATTVATCQEVQQLSSSETTQLLRELQWRQIFTSHTKYLFQHIVEHQHAKAPSSSSTRLGAVSLSPLSPLPALTP